MLHLLSCHFLMQGYDLGKCSLQGMSLVPAVTELLLAELLYLQYDNPTRPVFMYINSAGVQARLCAARRKIPNLRESFAHSPWQLRGACSGG